MTITQQKILRRGLIDHASKGGLLRARCRWCTKVLIWFHQWRVDTYDHLLSRIAFEEAETLQDRCAAEDRIKELKRTL